MRNFDAIIPNDRTQRIQSTTYTVASWKSLNNSMKLLMNEVTNCPYPTVNRLTVEIFNG